MRASTRCVRTIVCVAEEDGNTARASFNPAIVRFLAAPFNMSFYRRSTREFLQAKHARTHPSDERRRIRRTERCTAGARRVGKRHGRWANCAAGVARGAAARDHLQRSNEGNEV